MSEPPKWLLRQEGVRYRMKCPVCGYSYEAADRKIPVRKQCPGCGTVFSDRDRVLRLAGAGELIEEEGGNKRDGGADDQHQEIPAETKPARFPLLRKIGEIIHAGRGERH